MTVFARQTSRYAKLKNVGDAISGTILEIGEPRQSMKYNPNPNAPKVPDFWESSDGGAPRPKMEVVLTLQTQLNEGPDESGTADDGKRKLVVPVFYKDGSMLNAIQTAMFPTGATDLEIGAFLGVRHTGHDPDSANPDNPRKLYEAIYKRPAAGGGAFQAQQEPARTAPPQQAQQPNAAQYGQPAAAGGWGAQGGAQQPAQGGGWQRGGGLPNQGYNVPATEPQQQPAWGEPQHVQAGTGEVTGGWPPPQEAYRPPANPTPQQAQAATHFPAAQPGWQQPQQAQQPAAAAPPSSYQVDMALGLIQQGAPDNYISEQSGLSMEAVSALRNR